MAKTARGDWYNQMNRAELRLFILRLAFQEGNIGILSSHQIFHTQRPR